MNNDDYLICLVRRYEKFQHTGSEKTVVFIHFLS
jgi:hypothetical protein